ncbi:MAG: ABC transporter ATP-binding protein [Bacteroidota bacterium]
MNREVILETQNLNKFFYEPVKFQVLKDITFKVEKGEFVTIIGKSGCGKSTLLYCLSTMDTDYQGELYINSQQTPNMQKDHLAQLRGESIGFVFQFHYLLPEFTCLKNVMIPALKLGKYSPGEIEDRAYEKLKMLGIAEQAQKQASKLSGGQQQRVAIARALINDPAIIMGDEPTGNLDSKNTQIVLEIFEQLSQEFNQSIIAVTHDNNFARASDRTIEMEDGRIISHDKAL